MRTLENQEIAESAAEALVCGFVRDTNYHMLKFEGKPETVQHIMDVLYRSSPMVQTHLLNLFNYAVKWPKSKDFIAKFLDIGLINLLTFALKSDAQTNQEAGIALGQALMQKLSRLKDFKENFPKVAHDLVAANVVEAITKCLIVNDFELQSSITVSALELYAILSIQKVTHQAIMTMVHSVPTAGKVRKVTGPSSLSAAQKAVEILSVLNRSMLSSGQFNPLLLSIFSLFYNVVTLSPELNIADKYSKLISSSFRAISYCGNGLFRDKGIEFIYACRHEEAFGNAIANYQEMPDLVSALLDAIEADQNASVLNYSMDLLAFILQKVYHQRMTAVMVDQANRLYVRSLFLTVAQKNELWTKAAEYFEFQEKTMFVTRLIHVLSSFKDIALIDKMQEQVVKHKILDLLIELIQFGQNKPDVNEMIFLALGSLIGSSLLYPFDQRELAIKTTAGPSHLDDMRHAQRRANLDEGTSLRDLQIELTNPALFTHEVNPHAQQSVAQKIWTLESEWRGVCVAKANNFLGPTISSSSKETLPAVIAALRIIQIILRDGASVEDHFHEQALYYNFVDLISEMDSIGVFIALDVIGLMTGFSALNANEGVQQICNYLTSTDQMIKAKALEALVYCSLNASTHARIGEKAASAMASILRVSSHLSNAHIDSFFFVQSVLVIISRISVDDSVAQQLINSAIFGGLLEILKMDEESAILLSSETASRLRKVCIQELDPMYLKSTPTVMPDEAGIRMLAFENTCRFVKFESCRSVILAAGVAPVFLEIFTTEVQKLFGVESFPHLLQPLTIDMDLTQTGRDALESLSLLCHKPHGSLKNSLLQNSFTVESLVLMWASKNVHLAYMAKIVLTRVSTNKDATSNQSTGYLSSAAPWSKLVETQQIYLLYEFIDDSVTHTRGDIKNIVSFDEYTEIQVKSAACDALYSIILDAKKASNINASGVGGNASLSLDTIHRILQVFCSDTKLISKLEILRPLSSQAVTLLNYLFTLGTFENKDSSSGPGTASSAASIACIQLRSNDYQDKKQAILSLAGTIRASGGKKVDLDIPVPWLVEKLVEVTQMCAAKLDDENGGKPRTDAENAEFVQVAIDIVTIAYHLYQNQLIIVEYKQILSPLRANNPGKSFDNKETHDDPANLLDLRALYELLRKLYRRKPTAQSLLSSSVALSTLMDCLRIHIDSVNRIIGAGQALDYQLSPDLLAIWQVFNIILTLSKLGESNLAEKLFVGNYVKYLLDLFCQHPGALADIFYYCPQKTELLRNSFSQSQFPTLGKDMSIFERTLLTLNTLSCGKSMVLESVLEGGKVITTLAGMIDEDIKAYKVTLGVGAQPAEPVVDSGLTALDCYRARFRSLIWLNQNEEEFMADGLIKKLTILVNLCRSSSGPVGIVQCGDLVKQVLDLMAMIMYTTYTTLTFLCLSLIEGLIPILNANDKISLDPDLVPLIIDSCLAVATTVNDLNIIEKALFVVWLLGNHPHARSKLSHLDAVTHIAHIMSRLSYSNLEFHTESEEKIPPEILIQAKVSSSLIDDRENLFTLQTDLIIILFLL